MDNPFAPILARLQQIELTTQKTLEYVKHAHSPAPEIGGMALAKEVTGLSYARIYSLVSARAIPHMKRGNRLAFNRAELLDWIAAGKRDVREDEPPVSGRPSSKGKNPKVR